MGISVLFPQKTENKSTKKSILRHIPKRLHLATKTLFLLIHANCCSTQKLRQPRSTANEWVIKHGTQGCDSAVKMKCAGGWVDLEVAILNE